MRLMQRGVHVLHELAHWLLAVKHADVQYHSSTKKATADNVAQHHRTRGSSTCSTAAGTCESVALLLQLCMHTCCVISPVHLLNVNSDVFAAASSHGYCPTAANAAAAAGDTSQCRGLAPAAVSAVAYFA
jgi:hypothetical protein